MKRILVILLLILISNISSAQSGWGYVNYTSYRTHNGNGSQNQYGPFANDAQGFDVMFNTANSNTTIFRSGEVTLQTMANGSSTVPRWASDFFGYKFEFWFIPQETGLYRFGINSDDAADLFIDGVSIATYYGGHGANGYQIGSINMVKGQVYRVVARMQEFGGGEAFYFLWLKPSQIGGWGYWNDEVTNRQSVSLNLTFNFGQGIDRTKFTTKLLVQSNNQYLPTTNIPRTLTTMGGVDMSSDLDTTKIINVYKSHGVELNTTNATSLYNNIVTVSDVFLAFKELSNRGLFGNESGLEFSSGIQFMNADVDENGVFDERDTYKLIQHLVGSEIIGNGSNNLFEYIKLLPKSEYDGVTKLNWNTRPNSTTNIYSPINLSTTTLLNSFNYNVFWKGDVNISHSPSQINNTRINSGSSTIHAEMWSEIKDGYVFVTINVNPQTNQLSGVQFQLNYDNTMLEFDSVDFKTTGNPTNFGSNRGTFVNVGSIINNGIGLLDDKTQYVVKFKVKTSIKNSLGLISIGDTDAVSKDGIQLMVEMN